ncbi:hypothetical protein L484_009321 [Morus notabilis]|uniref:Uncharacterized protein n=1 Tax=Morus notabilis TaxID=981085 RepID=W9R365_9ROSA|nr:hypothetical protein L484_009321 [Morus notabilis]
MFSHHTLTSLLKLGWSNHMFSNRKGVGPDKPPIRFTYVRRRFHGKEPASVGEHDGTVCRVMDLQKKEEGAELAIGKDWVMKS